MAKLSYPNDDFFEGTKMSFGEHLEELRRALFRAVFGTAIGLAIGFFVARYVVDMIKLPLTDAMVASAIKKNIKLLESQFGKEFSPAIREFVTKHKVKFEVLYFESAEWRRMTESAILTGAEEPTVLDDQRENEPIDSGKEQVDSERDSTALDRADKLENKQTSAKNSDTTKTESPPLVIMGETLAEPQPVLMKARVWRPVEIQVTTLNAQEAFMIWMKAAMVSGLVVSSPWIFLQIWNFVAAGLYPHEKNYVFVYLPMSIGLFLAGAALAFFFVFKPVLEFLFDFNDWLNIAIDARISEWLSFVLFLPLGFGISFQLPLVMLFLNRIGLVSLTMYIEKWRIAVLVIFVISAILTPMDPISLLLMAVPLTLLYFMGLGLCKWMPRSKSPFAEGYDP